MMLFHSLMAVLDLKEAVLMLNFWFEGYFMYRKQKCECSFSNGGCSTHSLSAASTTGSMLLMVLKFT